MKYFKVNKGQYPNSDNSDRNENIFYGDSWCVKKESDKYYFEYVSGNMMGELKRIEISNTDYNLIVSQKMNIHDIFIKYNIW